MNDFDFKTKESCPRCGNSKIKGWHQLTDDEREIIKRLPESTTFEIEERIAAHRWCAKCLFEFTDRQMHDA